MSYFKISEAEFEITPEDAAAAFCEFGSDEQAVFFNEVARISQQWEAPFCMQMQHLTDDEDLKPAGRKIMDTIGSYAYSDNK